MTADFTFIVNPAAAKGHNGRLRRELQNELYRRQIRYELHETAGPGDATRLAAMAQSPIVVAVGGDGTVQEVANGIAGSGRSLGVIPAGSGNDFVKSFENGRSLSDKIDILSARKSVTIDLGIISTDLAPANSRYFVNGAGMGFDAEVAVRTRSMRRLSGTALYVAAVLRTLGTYRAPDFSLAVNGEVLNGRRLLVAVGNGACAAGSFYLTPRALVDDGLLDVCAIREMGLGAILFRLMPKVLRGKHLGLEGVRYFQGREIEIRSEKTFSVHADGEIVGQGVRRVGIRLAAGALKVIAGAR